MSDRDPLGDPLTMTFTWREWSEIRAALVARANDPRYANRLRAEDLAERVNQAMLDAPGFAEWTAAQTAADEEATR